MSRAVAGRGVSSRNKTSAKGLVDLTAGYFQRSELPLYSLVFLLPFLILFEICTYFHPSDTIALYRLHVFFERFGADGRFLPAMAVVGILLTWHIARGDKWTIRWPTIGGMGLESVLLALPLVALEIAMARWRIHVPFYVGGGIWANNAVLSLGAGIYEELVFRLMLMTVLFVILADALKMPHVWSNLLMVLISAVLFSLYHYLGYETFRMKSFVIRTLGGIYFGGLFLTRGFGITAGCHMACDIMIVGLTAWETH